MSGGSRVSDQTMGYLRTVDQLLKPLQGCTYVFMDNDIFRNLCRSDVGRANEVYWSEILGRAHLTAATALRRSRGWFAGVESAVSSNNLLLFAAAMRGFIESSADAMIGLIGVSVALADRYGMILSALDGKMSHGFSVCGALEEQLIHYLYARKIAKGQSAPKSHSADQVRNYLKILERAQIDGLLDAYAWLCDLSHPGASSVHMWLDAKSDYELTLNESRGASVISSFLNAHDRLVLDVAMCAFNPPFVTLATLNYFPRENFHTPELLSWSLSDINTWETVQARLAGAPVLCQSRV